MPREISLQEMQESLLDGSIKKENPVIPKVLPKSESTPAMQIALATAEAAVAAADAANRVAKNNETQNDTLIKLVEILSDNKIIKLKINRSKDKTISTIDLIRG